MNYEDCSGRSSSEAEFVEYYLQKGGRHFSFYQQKELCSDMTGFSYAHMTNS